MNNTAIAWQAMHDDKIALVALMLHKCFVMSAVNKEEPHPQLVLAAKTLVEDAEQCKLFVHTTTALVGEANW